MNAVAVTAGQLHILIIGCGNAARMHSRVLRRIGGVSLSYASRDGVRAAELCMMFNGRRAFTSYASGLRDDSVDCVLIATPTAFHCELALQAIAAGFDVIIEKPAFMSSCEADLVMRTATAAKRKVMVAENYFYKPITKYLRELIGTGSLGEITHVTIDARKRQKIDGWRADPTLSGGGALFEGGVHWISFASNIGLAVRQVSGVVTGGRPGCDTSTIVSIDYETGATGTLTHSWTSPAPLGHIRVSKVVGTAGTVVFESNGLAHSTSGPARSVGLHIGRDPFGYRTMLNDFLDTLRRDGQPQFTLAMARRDIESLEQIARGPQNSGFM